ncbi:MAG: GNAT family N-acetyltransferase [Smithella sp.]
MMIRRIKEDDIPSVVGMMLSNWDKIMSKYHSQEIVRKFRGEVTSDWLKRQMAWKQVLVVEKDDKIIATGALADLGKPDAPRLSVSQFFVQPHLHGQGIGKRLMGHLIQIARDGGCSLLHVPSSRNAVPFYAAVGFAVDATQPDVGDEITWMTMDLKATAEQAGAGDALQRA